VELIAWYLFTGGNSVEVKTEADDVTDCSPDDPPTTCTVCLFYTLCYIFA